MRNLALYHDSLRITGIVVYFLIESVGGTNTPPSCEVDVISELQTSAVRNVTYTRWTSCKGVDEDDGSTPGCYSGRQERLVRYLSNGTDRLLRRNGRQHHCTEYRRCFVPDRICDGVWSLWKESTCDCVTKTKTQTRYCYKRQQGTATSSFQQSSIHCFGSFGKYTKNRTSSCRPQSDDCKKTERSTILHPSIHAITSRFSRSEPKKPMNTPPPTTTSTLISFLNTTGFTLTSPMENITSTKGISSTDRDGIVSAPVLAVKYLVAIVICGALFIFIIACGIYFCLRRREKHLEKERKNNSTASSQSRQTEESPGWTQNDGRSYTRNDLYLEPMTDLHLEQESSFRNSYGDASTSANVATAETPPVINAYALPNTAAVEGEESIYWSIVT